VRTPVAVGAENAQGVGQFGECGLSRSRFPRAVGCSVPALAQVHLGQKALGADLHAQRLFGIGEQGNEKGGVEGAHGYIENNFFRPLRSASSLDDINEQLLTFSRVDSEHRRIDGQTVAQHLHTERKALRSLPAVLARPCVNEQSRVTKFGDVRYKTNRYSVPSRYVGRSATIEIFADSVRIIVNGELAAQHPRLFGRNDASLDPMHFLDALKHKHRAVERAEVFSNARFPQPLRHLLKRLVRRDRDTAGKQFMRVMELLETHRIKRYRQSRC
jgi:hypothetical protein